MASSTTNRSQQLIALLTYRLQQPIDLDVSNGGRLAQLIGVLEELSKEQGEQGVVPEDESTWNSKVEQFGRWIEIPNNVQISKVAGKGVALIAKRDIAINEVVVKIPKQRMMTISSLVENADPIWKNIVEDPLVSAIPSVALAAALLGVSLNTTSNTYQPYIQLLPSRMVSPLRFTLKQLQLLQKSSVLPQVIKSIVTSARQYLYIHKLLSKTKLSSQFTWSRWCWALSVVLSRQNYIPDANGNHQCTLVPLWDLINHDPSGEMTTQMTDSGLEMRAMKNFRATMEIEMYYGDRSSEELFLNYAFVPSNAVPNERLSFFETCQNEEATKLGIPSSIRINVNVNGTYEPQTAPQWISIAYGISFVAYLEKKHKELTVPTTLDSDYELILQYLKREKEILSDLLRRSGIISSTK